MNLVVWNYISMGKIVESVSVNETGKLSLKLGGATIFIYSDEDNLEEVWSVNKIK